MNSRTISTVKTFTTQSGEDGAALNRASNYDLQAQLRQGQEQRAITTKRPQGSKAGDSTTRLGPGPTIGLAVSDGKDNWREVLIPMNLIGNDAIADATGGGVIDVEARAALNSLLTLFRSLTVLNP